MAEPVVTTHPMCVYLLPTYLGLITELLFVFCLFVCLPVYQGAGKTTLISVLTGLYEPTSGRATVAGYNLTTEVGGVGEGWGKWCWDGARGGWGKW